MWVGRLNKHIPFNDLSVDEVMSQYRLSNDPGQIYAQADQGQSFYT